MRLMLKTALIGAWLLGVGLVNYELAAKTPGWFGTDLPGSRQATMAERQTPIHHRTGIRMVDRLIHEGEEALFFYGLRGRPASRAPLALASLQIPQ